MSDWRADLLKFWFDLEQAQWWKADPALDDRIKQGFLKTWFEKRQLPVISFLPDPSTALAGVILFDQFPRNMFRGHADAFSTDHLALAIAKEAIAQGFDQELEPVKRKFLYMPFQHSEDLKDQNRAIALFTEIGDQRQLGYAKHHREIIERYGRFPHRNAILGRTSRPDEIASGADKPW